MGSIAVDSLEQGMILSEDVRDINTRLLLSKGQKIVPKHIRILKIWGVTEVNVVGPSEGQDADLPAVDPEMVGVIKKRMDVIFQSVNLKNRTINEIYNSSLAYRLRSGRAETQPPEITSSKLSGDLNKADQIKRQIQKIDARLPETPSIISELNDVIEDPLATSNDVAQVVNKSPSLAALLLKIVNSAYYGFPSAIDRISRAVTIIGTKEISGLALGICVMRAFNDIPSQLLNMQAFIRHSLVCGMLARITAALKNVEQTEQLFISGLLHDIGKLIVFKYYPEHAKACMHEAAASGQSVYQAEKSIIGLNHTQISRYLLKKWRLPSELEDNIVYHHMPAQARQPIMAGIVQLADLIAHGLGIGSSGEISIPCFDDKLLDTIGISNSTVQMIIRQAVHQLGPMEAIFTGRQL